MVLPTCTTLSKLIFSHQITMTTPIWSPYLKSVITSCVVRQLAVVAGWGGGALPPGSALNTKSEGNTLALALVGVGVGARAGVGLLRVRLGVLQLGDDLAGVSTRVKVVGVLTCLLLGSPLSRMPGVHVLVLVEVVVLILVEVSLGHGGCFALRTRSKRNSVGRITDKGDC